MSENARPEIVVDDPNERPYPGYARELAAMQAKIKAAQQAGSAPLPGPLRETFADEPPVVCGYRLQPVTMGLHPVLVWLESPLLEIIRILREELARTDDEEDTAEKMAARRSKADARIVAEIKAEEEALVETVFCFVTPASELRALKAKGREAFRAAAMARIGDTLHPLQFAELQRAVSAHYAASFATAIQYEATEPGEPGTVFTAPPAAPKTASAGG